MNVSPFQPEALPHFDAEFQRAALASVRPEYSQAAHVGDCREAFGYVTPSRVRQSKAVRSALATSEASGLVSVPTTQTGGLSPSSKGLSGPVAASNAAAGVEGLKRELGAFVLDSAARRHSGLRMAVGFAARAHAVSEKGHRSDVAWMVTLTFAGTNADWRPTHLTGALSAFRMWCKRKGFACRYVWVAELQQRGVIHYHIAAWLPVGVSMPFWDTKGWWSHGMSNRIRARHATAYLMAYLKKDQIAERGALPKGARNYGVGGLDHSLRRARRWLRLPAFVQGNSSIHDDWRRAVGGGWIDPDGVRFESEFTSVLVGGVRCLLRVCEHPRSIEAAGPFSWLTDGAVSVAVH